MTRAKTMPRLSYKHTIFSCYIAYIVQATVNCLAPLLYVTFSEEFHAGLTAIALITTINFAVQLTTDAVSAFVIDRIGYRASIILAHVCALAGFIGMAVLPSILGGSLTSIIPAVVLYSIGGGLAEVLITPIVVSCPVESKSTAISMLQSFYCWGAIAVIGLSTLFFKTAGITNWRLLFLLWAILPAANIVYLLFVPLYPVVEEGSVGMRPLQLVKSRLFWLLLVMMICSGAAEMIMTSWTSAFAESGLHLPKTTGDLLGMGLYMVTEGAARALYGKFGEKLPLRTALPASDIAAAVCFLIAGLTHTPIIGLTACAFSGITIGIFWPGTFTLASEKLPLGGTAMFAFLALAGDAGCSIGPGLVSLVTNASGKIQSGILCASVFPLLIIVFSAFMNRHKQQVFQETM